MRAASWHCPGGVQLLHFESCVIGSDLWYMRAANFGNLFFSVALLLEHRVGLRGSCPQQMQGCRPKSIPRHLGRAVLRDALLSHLPSVDQMMQKFNEERSFSVDPALPNLYDVSNSSELTINGSKVAIKLPSTMGFKSIPEGTTETKSGCTVAYFSGTAWCTKLTPAQDASTAEFGCGCDEPIMQISRSGGITAARECRNVVLESQKMSTADAEVTEKVKRWYR